MVFNAIDSALEKWGSFVILMMEDWTPPTTGFVLCRNLLEQVWTWTGKSTIHRVTNTLSLFIGYRASLHVSILQHTKTRPGENSWDFELKTIVMFGNNGLNFESITESHKQNKQYSTDQEPYDFCHSMTMLISSILSNQMRDCHHSEGTCIPWLDVAFTFRFSVPHRKQSDDAIFLIPHKEANTNYSYAKHIGVSLLRGLHDCFNNYCTHIMHGHFRILHVELNLFFLYWMEMCLKNKFLERLLDNCLKWVSRIRRLRQIRLLTLSCLKILRCIKTSEGSNHTAANCELDYKCQTIKMLASYPLKS